MAFCFQADFRFRDAQSAAFWQQICDLLACVEPKRRVGRLTKCESQLKGESIMRKLAVAVALASTALASPALARDNSWYVGVGGRSEEHTSELQSLMRSSYAVFCLKKKNQRRNS